MIVDWTEVPYPSWWTERATMRRAQLDAAVVQLRRVVSSSTDLVGALVFGSYVRGTVGPESDLDVMLVTTEPANGDPGLRHLRLVERLALAIPCDLIVYDAEEFPRLVTERAFIAEAFRNGLWIDAATSA